MVVCRWHSGFTVWSMSVSPMTANVHTLDTFAAVISAIQSTLNSQQQTLTVTGCRTPDTQAYQRTDTCYLQRLSPTQPCMYELCLANSVQFMAQQFTIHAFMLTYIYICPRIKTLSSSFALITRSHAVARIANRTAKNCGVRWPRPRPLSG